MYCDLTRLSLPGSHGEANRRAETAAGEAVPDQQGAAEAEQRPGWVQLKKNNCHTNSTQQ